MSRTSKVAINPAIEIAGPDFSATTGNKRASGANMKASLGASPAITGSHSGSRRATAETAASAIDKLVTSDELKGKLGGPHKDWSILGRTVRKMSTEYKAVVASLDKVHAAKTDESRLEALGGLFQNLIGYADNSRNGHQRDMAALKQVVHNEMRTLGSAMKDIPTHFPLSDIEKADLLLENWDKTDRFYSDQMADLKNRMDALELDTATLYSTASDKDAGAKFKTISTEMSNLMAEVEALTKKHNDFILDIRGKGTTDALKKCGIDASKVGKEKLDEVRNALFMMNQSGNKTLLAKAELECRHRGIVERMEIQSRPATAHESTVKSLEDTKERLQAQLKKVGDFKGKRVLTATKVGEMERKAAAKKANDAASGNSEEIQDRGYLTGVAGTYETHSKVNETIRRIAMVEVEEAKKTAKLNEGGAVLLYEIDELEKQINNACNDAAAELGRLQRQVDTLLKSGNSAPLMN